MGRTGTVEYKAFLKVAKMFIFTLHSVKTQRLDQRLFVMLMIIYTAAFRGVFFTESRLFHVCFQSRERRKTMSFCSCY